MTGVQTCALPICFPVTIYTELVKRSNATSAWDGGAYTTQFFTDSAYISGMATAVAMTAMFGLNSDPKTDSSYASIDFAWYFDSGTLRIYENGTNIGAYGSYTTSTVVSITYDGKVIRYWKDGVLQRTVDRPTGAALYADVSIYGAGQSITNLAFGPGDQNKYWAEHTEGYLFRGGWMAYRQYYPGDIVKLRGDVYMCRVANFNGHPIYKNGLFSSTADAQVNPDWEKIASGSHATDDDYVEVLPNMPPLGWTKYRGSWFEPGHQRNTIRSRFFTASGKTYMVGDGTTTRSGGSGISGDSTAAWIAVPPVSMTFDHWDYRFGRLPGFQGQPPKIIQLIGNDYFGKALFDNGEVYSWGYGGHGQNGNGTTNDSNLPVRVGYVNGTHDYRNSGTGAGYLANTRIIKLACGVTEDDDNTHSVAALDSDGNLWTWGYNGYGQLGFDNTTNVTTPTAVTYNGTDVRNAWYTSGEYCSLYVTRTSSLQPYSCGYNGYYNLGRSYTDANRTHSNGGNSGTAWDIYRDWETDRKSVV